MTEFLDTLCIVTGGTRGIGKAIVAMLAQEGAEVHSIDKSLPADGSRNAASVHTHGCDITDLTAVQTLVEQLAKRDKPVGVLVNNAAAVTRPASILDLEPEEWRGTMDVNINGTFNITRSILPLMRDGGCIVNIASTFAHVGAPQRVAYATTKGAILAFTRSLALELAPRKIRVNSISPGGIATDRLIEQFGSKEAADDYLVPLHPIGRTGTPQDIADAVRYIASSRAGFMTGADLLVDGGFTAQ